MENPAPLNIAALVQDFLSAASAPGESASDGAALAELAYGLDQVVSEFLDHQGMQVDAYAGVEQQLLGALAHDLQDQAGIDPDGLLDGSQAGFDTHAVLEALSQHWPEGLVDGPSGGMDLDLGSSLG
jgi:hypothetical protein